MYTRTFMPWSGSTPQLLALVPLTTCMYTRAFMPWSGSTPQLLLPSPHPLNYLHECMHPHKYLHVLVRLKQRRHPLQQRV